MALAQINYYKLIRRNLVRRSLKLGVLRLEKNII